MIERTLVPYIKKTSASFPVLLVTGMRQVGKTTLLNGMKEKSRNYISLDNITLRAFAKRDPEGFIKQYPPPCIIDEVQYAPELFPFIKIWVDEQRRRGLSPRGAFWLTGSQQYRLMEGVQESLAGRVAIVDMLGMSMKEINKQAAASRPFLPSKKISGFRFSGRNMNQKELFTHIWRGSFPELAADSSIDRDTFFRGYIRSYIERDVKDFYGLKNDIAFHDFIRAAAARTGSLLNYSNLCKDTGIDLQTAKLWLNILERSGVIKLLEPYSPNITKRIIKTPKLYFLDTGLASYLAGWDSPKSLMSGAQNGAMLETWAFAEILKSYWHNGRELNIFFYRDKDGNEVDFVIEKNMTLYPVEIKKTATPGGGDTKNIRALSKLNRPLGPGAVLCMQKEPVPLDSGLFSFPLWEI